MQPLHTEIRNSLSTDSVPAYAPRPKRDPLGLSALFVAMTIVCALGASAILATARNGALTGAALSDAFDGFLGEFGLTRTAASAKPREPTVSLAAIERDIAVVATNLDALNMIVDKSTRDARTEFARVHYEIASMKSEVADLRTARDQVAAARESAPTWIAGIEASLPLAGITHNVVWPSVVPPLQKVDGKDTIDVIAALSDKPHASGSDPETTGSIPPKPVVSAPSGLPRGWSVFQTEAGVVVKGPSGAHNVKIGSVVPGLGRIDAIKRRGRNVHLVTSKVPDAPPSALMQLLSLLKRLN